MSNVMPSINNELCRGKPGALWILSNNMSKEITGSIIDKEAGLLVWKLAPDPVKNARDLGEDFQINNIFPIQQEFRKPIGLFECNRLILNEKCEQPDHQVFHLTRLI